VLLLAKRIFTGDEVHNGGDDSAKDYKNSEPHQVTTERTMTSCPVGRMICFGLNPVARSIANTASTDGTNQHELSPSRVPSTKRSRGNSGRLSSAERNPPFTFKGAGGVSYVPILLGVVIVCINKVPRQTLRMDSSASSGWRRW